MRNINYHKTLFHLSKDRYLGCFYLPTALVSTFTSFSSVSDVVAGKSAFRLLMVSSRTNCV